MSAPLHHDVEHLAFLLGTWRGRGVGEYPTIESFEYTEEVSYTHVGKPFLAYTQRTRNAVTELPLHAEAGYVRPVGLDRLEFVVAQPSGIVEVDEGPLVGQRFELDSQSVVVTRTARPVSAVRREVEVVGDDLSYTLDMEAVEQPMQLHLRAVLHRVADLD